VVLSLLSFTSATVRAQDPWEPRLDRDLPSKLLEDLPGLGHPDNVPLLIVGSLLTAYEWGTDDRRNGLRDDLKTLRWDGLFDLGNFYGEGWIEGGLAVSCSGLGLILEEERLACFGRDLGESLLISTVLVTGLKVAVGRTRPNGDDFSFPSGHSIVAFCSAPVIERYWGWGAGVPAYLLAAVTGLARVEDSRHYLSDVLAGATLGILVGESVLRHPGNLSVSAFPGGAGLRLAFN